MNLLISTNSDPYWNLATEEFLLKNSEENFIFLYINRPTVVIGKHQITQKEINTGFTKSNNILIARRLSGGGTVFHDEGNLNFSFIRSIKPGENSSYQPISQSIHDFLITLGIAVSYNERNDFVVSGKKISGSAMHLYKNRLLAHNTLLVNCHLPSLSKSLKGNIERFTDKSISSVRSEVMNLTEAEPSLSISNLISNYTHYISQHAPHLVTYDLTVSDKSSISELSLKKYSTTDWIYNYSPKYIYRNSISINERVLAYSLEIEKGVIKNILTEPLNEPTESMRLILNSLLQLEHNPDSLTKWLNSGIKSTLKEQLFSNLF